MVMALLIPMQGGETGSPSFFSEPQQHCPASGKRDREHMAHQYAPFLRGCRWEVFLDNCVSVFQVFPQCGGPGVGAEASKFPGDRIEQLGPAVCGPLVVPALHRGLHQ